LVNGTTLLLDLDGVSVMRVERCEDGGRRVRLATADASAWWSGTGASGTDVDRLWHSFLRRGAFGSLRAVSWQASAGGAAAARRALGFRAALTSG
jgi:hypothetical protein